MSSGLTWTEDKERLAEILSREEYAHQQGEQGSWLNQLLEPLFRALSRMFELAELPSGTASTVSTIILVLFVMGLLLFLYWLSRRIVREQRLRQPFLAKGEKIRTYTDYLQEARERGHKKEWREGERSLFLALLVYLQKRAWIRVEPWKTNWEYAEEIQLNQPWAVDLFRSHARIFEQVWYGQGAVSEGQFWDRLKHLETICREEGLDG
ncbi:hypothetical protein AN963_23060 [Brevibacillus choshinensis]|uniref:Protein-glutamine gamma-glutamyltransferase-like C-terminal domain-containing protein n=1 Tax=Brevibacillus choshinensis TaxID=54911 RepID=A0ABR5N1B4_BRECH|nr:DUF4129 domain-containing protein [Brevibacillus choshinensis]KQL44292.1 hypothetical protein AN963_23060 [Brevibacillus choshinensis]